MGYRSDVVIALTNSANTAKEHNPTIQKAFDSCGFVLVTDDCNRNLYEVKDVKWYEGYPHVDAVEAFLKTIPDEDYYFARAGEDLDDVERHGGYDAGVWLKVEITYWNN
jgi:hypothetical protein